MFYSDIRPITQQLNDATTLRYKKEKIKHEINKLVQDEVAKIAERSYRSPYIEDHYFYMFKLYGDASEGSWKNPPKEPEDIQTSFSDQQLKMLNVI
jgi:hypothetical protein